MQPICNLLKYVLVNIAATQKRPEQISSNLLDNNGFCKLQNPLGLKTKNTHNFVKYPFNAGCPRSEFLNSRIQYKTSQFSPISIFPTQNTIYYIFASYLQNLQLKALFESSQKMYIYCCRCNAQMHFALSTALHCIYIYSRCIVQCENEVYYKSEGKTKAQLYREYSLYCIFTAISTSILYISSTNLYTFIMIVFVLCIIHAAMCTHIMHAFNFYFNLTVKESHENRREYTQNIIHIFM